MRCSRLGVIIDTTVTAVKLLIKLKFQEYLYICRNKMPTRCNRGFYCRSDCLLNVFQAPLCPSSGAQEYYAVVAACGVSCCGFQVAGLVWSWGLCVRFAGCCRNKIHYLICGNKMPTRCNRGFYCRCYCLLNMFRAPLCPSSGAQEYYTLVAACGISCCDFQVAGLVWSWGLCVRFAGCCKQHLFIGMLLVITTNSGVGFFIHTRRCWIGI